MNSKDLIYFIGTCLTIDKHPKNLVRVTNELNKNTIDWEKFVAMSSSHLVTPVIYLKFKKTKLLSLLPEELVLYLEEIYAMSFRRNQMILAQVNEISRVLVEKEVYPILLKGAGNLEDQLYDDPAERIMGDIDFLVDEPEYLQTAEILENIDYAASKMYYYDDTILLKHYPRLVHPEHFASAEVHRLPTDEAYTKWLDQKMIRSEMRKAASNFNCYVLSDRHKIFLNFIHCQLTNKGHKTGVVSLRDVYDLYLLAQRENLGTLDMGNLPYNKVSAYFQLAQKLLNVDLGFSAQTALSERWFLYKHDLNFKWRTFYLINKISIELIDRFARYTGLMLKSVYSRKTRQFVIRRLKNAEWYKSQAESWKRMFRMNF